MSKKFIKQIVVVLTLAALLLTSFAAFFAY